MRKVPALARILSVDYVASTGVLIPVVAWAFFLTIVTLAPEEAGWWASPLAPGALTALGALLIAWRVTLIRAVFAVGVEAPATVQSVTYARGSRVRVRYAYTYAGQAYAGGSTVSRGRLPVTLKAGDKVTVVLDPGRPRVAFLRDLYQT